ncbi:ATP-binding protein [Zavarzinia compransoris]|uniref:hybrid sensor histidine kinase/response regulator n=1 Tax=Zavarzinia marina TaxID=2911065 RepID=UPI001F471892|nr:ATP-binding protein [Zavarzinia marina]MCF4167458.1 ATP-binding protein [Zavarzinia marina]
MSLRSRFEGQKRGVRAVTLILALGYGAVATYLVDRVLVAGSLFTTDLDPDHAQRLREATDQITVAFLGLFALGLVLIAIALAQARSARNLLAEVRQANRESGRLGLAVAASSDGIALTDPAGNVLSINRAFCAMLGLSYEAAAIGRRWSDLYPPAARGPVIQAVAAAMADDGHWRGNVTCPRRDGEVIEQDLSVTRLEDGGVALIARDITRQTADLHARRLLEQQLLNAQKMEAIGRLTGGFAHDFNNILASVQGYAEFLSEDTPKDVPAHRFAERILTATRRGRVLVDRILSFGRPAAGGTQACDVNAAVEETAGLLAGVMPSNVRIETRLGPSGLFAGVSVDQLVQALMNLGVNGRDAMAESGGTLTFAVAPEEGEARPADAWPSVRLGRQVPGLRYVRIRVTDQGAGIPEDSLDRIFEPFFTTKPTGAGTGLGLAAVQGIVTGSGGELVLASRVGAGCRVDLFLPAADAMPAAPAEVAAPPRLSLRVLVCEDDTILSEATAEILTRGGYGVEVVHDGASALRRLRETPAAFDVILTDETMPGMRGTELIGRLRADGMAIPAVVWSANAGHDLLDSAGLSGPAARVTFCRKPAAADQLLAAIARAAGFGASADGNAPARTDQGDI